MANTEQNLRRELGAERERLTEAVGGLREEIDEAKTLGAKIRSRLPIAATVGALSVGFVKAGGIGAIARLLFRRGRKADEKAATGRKRLSKRR